MSEANRAALWPDMMATEEDTLELVLERVTVQHGLTFSEAAMELLHDQLIVYVGTRIARRWDATREPPTRLQVTITVTAS